MNISDCTRLAVSAFPVSALDEELAAILREVEAEEPPQRLVRLAHALQSRLSGRGEGRYDDGSLVAQEILG